MNYAGFWRRLAAYLIDGFFMIILYMILAPLSIIASFLYYPVFNSSSLRGTPGKYLMGLVVVNADGSQLSFKTAIIRHFMTMLSSCLFFLGYFMFFFTEKKQTLHDYVASTVVLNENQPSTNVFNVWWNEMKSLINSTGPTTNVSRPAQNLEELYNLYQKGILTEEEYNSKKEEYLRRL